MTTHISIILPTYRGEKYLELAIRSVFAQSYDSWELLICDDCGGDRSLAIADEFAALDSRIRVSRALKNRGLYGTLNDAIDDCRGQWIVILMQDDELKPDHFQTMVDYSARFPAADAIWAEIELIDNAGKPISTGQNTGRAELIEPSIEAWLSCLLRGCIWTISGSFTRASHLRDFRFRADLPHASDFEFLLRTIRSVPMVYYERPLTIIRIHAEQTTNTHAKVSRDLIEYRTILREQSAKHHADLSSPQWSKLRCTYSLRFLRRAASRLRAYDVRGAVVAFKQFLDRV
jgi:glycosyltransferase involved in cell wall biosynthesis